VIFSTVQTRRIVQMRTLQARHSIVNKEQAWRMQKSIHDYESAGSSHSSCALWSPVTTRIHETPCQHWWSPPDRNIASMFCCCFIKDNNKKAQEYTKRYVEHDLIVSLLLCTVVLSKSAKFCLHHQHQPWWWQCCSWNFKLMFCCCFLMFCSQNKAQGTKR
jgi:hypothetical protein